jgi:hypothetical protein
MATTKKQEEPAVQPGTNDELAHLLALFLKYQGVPQVVLVHDLTKAGLTPSRIASLILTTSNTVSQQKREKRPVWPPKVKVGKNGSD